MNFNSPEFFIFLMVTITLYSMLFRRERSRDLFLLFASYFFYMSWNWKYAGIIAFATGVSFMGGLLLEREERPVRRKLVVAASLAASLGVLAVFKYFNFFMEVAGEGASLLGMEMPRFHHSLMLPVGISFYTFQTISYTIDVYRRTIRAESRLLKYAVFVSFFPQLVAGPIVRAAEFLPQLRRTPVVNEGKVNQGLLLIFRGLFKKIIISDLLATLAVDQVFAHPGNFSSFDLWMALYGYSFQIYNDFSGYSDVAIGVARLFGYELPVNFNRPYLAENVREFWRRWHISLSTWLRDYLYLALGGNRRGAWRVRFNLLVTMLLGGLWHGASLNFLFWGLWHGLLLVGCHRFQGRRSHPVWDSIVLRRLFCFHLVVFGWLIFRVESLDQFMAYLRGLLALTGGSVIQPLYFGILLFAAVIHCFPQGRLDAALLRIVKIPPMLQAVVYAALLLLFVGCTLDSPAFIYFQF